MIRPGVGVAAGVLVAVLAAAGCANPAVDPQQAHDAFRVLSNRVDLTYRFEQVVLSDGTADVQRSTQAVGAVAGSDSAYRLTQNRDPAGQGSVSDLVISGDRAFRRVDAQAWEATARPNGFAGGDLATFLPLIGAADLTVAGRVDFDGASRVQLANIAAIPLTPDGDDPAVITRLDLLIGDDGTPVRAVAEFDPGVGDVDRVIVEFRFADFGAEISIQPPDVP
jgi:hypothetical protein